MPSHKIIENPDPARLQFRSGRFYVKKMAERMQAGSNVFVANVDRRLAYYYRKRLTALIGEEVEAEPTSYADNDGHILDGYRFRTAPRAKK